MTAVRIWVDADSCPRRVRRYILRSATDKGIAVSFVANRAIPIDNIAGRDGKAVCDMVVCDAAKDAADDVIVSRAGKCDAVVTRDVLLAARLVERGVCVMNDRGTLFSRDNIEDKIRDRDFDLQLVQIGFGGSSAAHYGGKEMRAFAECFERAVRHCMQDAVFCVE